jgi:hypothetical protein
MNTDLIMGKGKLWLNLLMTGMTLGTAWAVRGQFGHEQGAAWAGALGGMIILIIANRQDWHSRFITSSLASAIGWGLGGMISYGIVVGYARALDFGNVYYGLAMLFVIGGLYGFIGGGLFGLSLEERKDRKIDWGTVIVAMLSGAIITYFFIIMQLEWLMTPPRSEAWAACLGMVFGLAWYLHKHRFTRPLHVALCSSLGGGFGFAFGNFLQVLGRVSEIDFNFWNVMEYSIGFFGGIGMAWGVFTTRWDGDEGKSEHRRFVPLLFLVALIPLVVWRESMNIDRLTETYQRLGEAGDWSGIIRLISFLLVTGFAIFALKYQHRWEEARNNRQFFLTFFALYIFYSWLITGAWYSTYRIEQYLYLANYALIAFIIPRLGAKYTPQSFSGRDWLFFYLGFILIIALLAWIALNSHGPWEGYHERFKTG